MKSNGFYMQKYFISSSSEMLNNKKIKESDGRRNERQRKFHREGKLGPGK